MDSLFEQLDKKQSYSKPKMPLYGKFWKIASNQTMYQLHITMYAAI